MVLLPLSNKQIISPVDPRTVVAGDKDENVKDVYTSDCAASGWDAFATVSDVHRWLRENVSTSLSLHCTESGQLRNSSLGAGKPRGLRQICYFRGQRTPLRFSNDRSSLLSFDQQISADIVFRFRSLDPSSRYIFASKEYLVKTCSYFKTRKLNLHCSSHIH